ncbi:MAG: hypothetical protein LUD55_06530 [Oscillospiraceae bacterium]|nr:hypothetical protein [Oscillospiraceae bacterium]
MNKRAISIIFTLAMLLNGTGAQFSVDYDVTDAYMWLVETVSRKPLII